ncbi:MAG TPA: DUF4198 domain-containing protein [Phnomibacter sp.]|nr:DUF4198 domain-containing protein [Phnomibacter sp.]
MHSIAVRFTIVFALLQISILGLAHEFWLEPISFFKKKTCVRFRVGEHFDGKNWTGDFNKVGMLNLVNFQSQNSVDAQGALSKPGDSLKIKLPFQGTQALVYASTNSYIELDAEKFNAYLQEDGLAEIAAWRKAHGQDTAKGKEYYQRCAKLLLQNGKQTTPVNFPTALALDIVPHTNPYSISGTTPILFSVYFMQRPLAKAEIKTWHIHKEQLTTTTIQMTNGTFSLPVSPEGKWMVSLVKMVENRADSRADWQSYWGSLVWGYF